MRLRLHAPLNSRLSAARMAALTLLACATVVPQARAGVELVTNGGFETTTGSTTGGQLGYNVNATGWTVGSGGYTFLFNSAAGAATGVTGQFGTLSLWDTSNGGANSITASPNAGNFLALDGAFQQQPIYQTLTGLTTGVSYAVTFNWAGAQQSGFNGTTTEAMAVLLGNSAITVPGSFSYANVCGQSQVQCTTSLNNINHGFTGWQTSTMYFIASSSTQVLSFLALGTPNGQPPFTLLDGISTQIPEPASLAMLAAAVSVLVALRRRKVLG